MCAHLGVVSGRLELEKRIEQFQRDCDDLNQQWSVRYDDMLKKGDEEKARMQELSERKVKALEEDVKQELAQQDLIVASIPEKVKRECSPLNEEIQRLKKELENLFESIPGREAAAANKARHEADVAMSQLTSQVAHLEAMLAADKSKVDMQVQPLLLLILLQALALALGLLVIPVFRLRLTRL